MKSTELYVELIIIGLEASIWMCMLLINIVGTSLFDFLGAALTTFSSSLLVIGILYIIGLLMDRFSDLFFQKIEDTIRVKSGLKTDQNTIVWERFNQEYFFRYVRSRMRILRASVFNIPLIAACFLWFLVKNSYSILLVLYVIGMASLFTFISWRAFIKSANTYYDKAKTLQLSEKCVELNAEMKKTERNNTNE